MTEVSDGFGWLESLVGELLIVADDCSMASCKGINKTATKVIGFQKLSLQPWFKIVKFLNCKLRHYAMHERLTRKTSDSIKIRSERFCSIGRLAKRLSTLWEGGCKARRSAGRASSVHTQIYRGRSCAVLLRSYTCDPLKAIWRCECNMNRACFTV